MALFKKTPLRSVSRAAERREILPWKLAALGGVIIVSLVGAIILAHLSRFRIDTIVVSGNVVVSDWDIRNFVNAEVAGSYFWVVPRNNIALYPRAALTAAIADTFKRFETVSVSTVNAHTIKVTVAERKPAYLWCGPALVGPIAGPDALEAKNCFFLDDIGYVFAEAPYFSGNVYLIFYGALPNPPPVTPLGQQFIPEGEFTTLANSLHDLEKLGLTPLALEVLPSDGSEAPDYRVDLTGGGTLMFKSTDAARLGQIMLSVLSSDIFASTSPATLGSKVDYIDARYGDKVVYRLHGKAAPVAASTTVTTD